MENWQKKLLDAWWPYSLLLILLYNVETSAERKIVETGRNLLIFLIYSLVIFNLYRAQRGRNHLDISKIHQPPRTKSDQTDQQQSNPHVLNAGVFR